MVGGAQSPLPRGHIRPLQRHLFYHKTYYMTRWHENADIDNTKAQYE